jgi:DivIVA domain-containing protein
MLLLYASLAVFAAAVLFGLAVLLLPAGVQIAPPPRDTPMLVPLPGEALSEQDLRAVRLPVALRGYRFAETDVLLDRLASELAARDAEIARLRGLAESNQSG